MADLREPFNEEQIEQAALTRTPISFIVVGKPGSGKSTLAKRLAAVWKCQLIDGCSTIEQILKEDTELAEQVKDVLFSGRELSEELVAQIIEEKLKSPEIQHYGYVLDCFPSFEESWKSLSEQIEFIKSLPQPPNVIINLKIPDVDLLKRRVGQKIDPLNNEVFIKSVYDPDGPLATVQPMDEEEEEDNEKEDSDEEEGDGQEEDERDEVIEDEFQEDLGEVDSLHLLAPNIADRLVKRQRDETNTVQAEITHYKQHILAHIEDYIIQHNHQYVIELDANLSSKELFRSLLLRLTTLGLPRAVAPKRLVQPDDEEVDEEPQGLDTEQFITQASDTGILIPKFRWRRSRWGQYCPVELAQGNMLKGRLEFSVGLLDKLYCLSSTHALTAFIKCPRRYLVPPSPRIPCKICVLGPPSSGKTTLVKALVQYYDAMVIDIEELMKPTLDNALKKTVQEAIEKAKDEEIIRLTIEQDALSSQKGEAAETVITDNHPEVKAAVQIASAKALKTNIEPSAERYAEALVLGIQEAEKRRRESRDERVYGGWVTDGFPFSRDQWSFMIDAKGIPDFIVSLETDGGEETKLLMKRYCVSEGIPYPFEENEGEESKKIKLPSILEQWQIQTTQYESQWNLLSTAIRGSTANILKVSPFLSTADAIQTAVQYMEGVFKLTAKDLSGLDEEGDIDDDPIIDEPGDDEEEEEEENEESAAKKRKPWGDSAHFCPVSLSDHNVLWPGQPDYTARYRERLYYFSSEEAKEKFITEPVKYVANDRPLQTPAPRVFLLGPRASGKTAVGQTLAKQLNVFHISFREYLQEHIMTKMKRPPLQDQDEHEEEEKKDEGEEVQAGNDLDDDVAVALNEKETELRNYLLHGESLSEETLEEYSTLFWSTEPYKSSGFIMEGLPYQGDELRYLCSKGLYPDAVAILEVDEGCVVERVLPDKLNKWRNKRDKRIEKRRLIREERLKEWENDKAEKKVMFEEEYKRKKSEREAMKKEEEEEEDNDEGEGDDPFIDEYQDQLAELDAEEPPEEEDGEEETEEDVEERMKTTLIEKYEEQIESLTSIQDVLAEFLIPCHMVPAKRKVSVVTYSLGKVLSPYFKNRTGLLTKCTPIDPVTAKKLLDHGYKQLSIFGYWCPVKLLEETHSILPPASIKSTFPVIYRQRIYFIFSALFRTLFIADPESYLNQTVPRLPVSMCVAIIGPPKCGKTTVAERFVKEYGCVRLSIGEAIRRVISQFPESDLTKQILSHLKVGQTVPEELRVLALERALLDATCSTRGYILDGWPMTKSQVDLLNKYRIIPVRIIELQISKENMLKRAEIFRSSTDRIYPMHDSPSILLTRSSHYHKNVITLKAWYTEQHDNWTVVNGERNHWNVWHTTNSVALNTAVQIQQYLIRITNGDAASIDSLCVTPQEFKGRLGLFNEYCPVSFVDRDELVDCSYQQSLKYAVEYRAKYYKTAGENELRTFLSNPEAYINDYIQLPSDLPYKRSKNDIKEMFPRQFEIQGFCPVTYIEGKKRYKALVPGNSNWSVEYKGKLFCCSSKEQLEKFMKYPSYYEVTNLPVKLPPTKQPLSILSLPMLGYMEQSVATPIINSLTDVGCYKPKYPFLTATQSALVYVALHLKAYNPKSSTYIREKYRKKLQLFEERCQLIGGLGEEMKKGYRDPQERPIEFERQMTKFLDLVRI